jgi:hypothetical protein
MTTMTSAPIPTIAGQGGEADREGVVLLISDPPYSAASR